MLIMKMYIDFTAKFQWIFFFKILRKYINVRSYSHKKEQDFFVLQSLMGHKRLDYVMGSK